MSLEVIVYILTALAAVVIVLTRLRLGRDSGGAGIPPGRARTGQPAHRGRRPRAGGLGRCSWSPTTESTLGGPLVGVIALVFWWIVVIAGLLILVRWLPSRGKHASEGTVGLLVRGPGVVDPGPRRHARRGVRLHLRLHDRGGVTVCCDPTSSWPSLSGSSSRPRSPSSSVPATTAGGATAAAPSNATPSSRPASIGRSVRGRAIKAYHLGEPGKPKVVLISSMHGDEQATRQILLVAQGRQADPRHRPVGGADVQPRRHRPRTPARTPAAST